MLGRIELLRLQLLILDELIYIVLTQVQDVLSVTPLRDRDAIGREINVLRDDGENELTSALQRQRVEQVLQDGGEELHIVLLDSPAILHGSPRDDSAVPRQEVIDEEGASRGAIGSHQRIPDDVAHDGTLPLVVLQRIEHILHLEGGLKVQLIGRLCHHLLDVPLHLRDMPPQDLLSCPDVPVVVLLRLQPLTGSLAAADVILQTDAEFSPLYILRG